MGSISGPCEFGPIAGGFTSAARAEFGEAPTLIDLPERQQLYVQYYDHTVESTRALLPLKKLRFPARA